jgi:hypothetical protein
MRPLLRYASSSLAVNLLPTILNPCSAAQCICSLGHPGLGRVVYRYVCASTSAASSVFGIILPCSSTDRKDESRFLERFRLSECSRFQLLICAYGAFYCLYTMRRCVLCEELCLLRWLNLSFFVFRFFLLLVALIAFVRHNDTLKACFCLHPLV